MKAWPLDGIIGAMLIVIALFCFISAGFWNRPRHFVARKENGYYRMGTLPSHGVLALGLFILVGVVAYGVAQAGHCPTMTATQNLHNWQIGVLVALLFWGGSAFFLYTTFLTSYRFSAEEVSVKRAFQKRRIFKWIDLAERGLSQRGPYLKFRDGGRFYPPLDRQGSGQLLNLTKYWTTRVDEAPLAASYDPESAAQLPGKRALCVVTTLDADFQEKQRESYFLRFISAGPQGIVVEREGGTQKNWPANLNGICPFDAEDFNWVPEVAALQEEQYPEFICDLYAMSGVV